MPFYELIFETGSHSVAQYDNDEEAMDAVTSHHDRAKSGETGGPSGHPAERVVKVLKYDQHPADLNEAGLVEPGALVRELQRQLDAHANNQGGQVSYAQAMEALAHMNSPVELGQRDNPSNRHESMYKMQELEELQVPGVTS